MAKKPRNYAQEYARRIARGLKQGKSRKRARGHGSTRQMARKSVPQKIQKRLDFAYLAMRNGKSLTESARVSQVTTERLERFLRDNKLAQKRKGRWYAKKDMRVREIDMLTSSGWLTLRVRGFDVASEIGKHRAAVRAFKDQNDRAALVPFVGKSIKDIDGKRHEFETRPNTLLRSFKTGRSSFENIYSIASI